MFTEENVLFLRPFTKPSFPFIQGEDRAEKENTS
jgi:hypothetical protein